MNLSLSVADRPARCLSVTTLAAVLACTLVNLPLRAEQTDAASPDQTYSLKRVYKAGDVDFYRIKVDQTVNGAVTNNQDYVVKMDITMKETTKSVGSEGQVTAIDEYTRADATIGGQDMDLKAMDLMPKLTVSKDKEGKISVTADGGKEPLVQQISTMAKAMMQSQSASLPTKPVKVGDSWTAEIAGTTAEDDTSTKLTIKLDGIEVIDGVKALRLKTITDSVGGPQADTKIHGEGTMYVDAVNGKTLRMTSKASGTAKGSKITSEVVFEKTKAEIDKPAKKGTGPK